MPEFNTEDDMHTIMSYTRHEFKDAEYIIVDIDFLVQCYGDFSELVVNEWIYKILHGKD